MTRLVPDRLQRREIFDAKITVFVEKKLSIEVVGEVEHTMTTERNETELANNFQLTERNATNCVRIMC